MTYNKLSEHFNAIIIIQTIFLVIIYIVFNHF